MFVLFVFIWLCVQLEKPKVLVALDWGATLYTFKPLPGSQPTCFQEIEPPDRPPRKFTFSTNDLAKLLSYFKVKVKWGTSHVVYFVPCEEPEHQHIIQTKTPLQARTSELEKCCDGDMAGIQPDENNDNGIPYHLCEFKVTGNEQTMPKTSQDFSSNCGHEALSS